MVENKNRDSRWIKNYFGFLNVPVEKVVVPGIAMRQVAKDELGLDKAIHDWLNLWQICSHFVCKLLWGKFLGDQGAGPEHVFDHVIESLCHLLSHFFAEQGFSEGAGIFLGQSIKSTRIGADEVKSRSVEGCELLQNKLHTIEWQSWKQNSKFKFCLKFKDMFHIFSILMRKNYFCLNCQSYAQVSFQQLHSSCSWHSQGREWHLQAMSSSTLGMPGASSFSQLEPSASQESATCKPFPHVQRSSSENRLIRFWKKLLKLLQGSRCL